MDNNLNDIMEYLQDKLDNSVDDFDRMYWEMRIRDIEEDVKECENQPTQERSKNDIRKLFWKRFCSR